MDVTTVLGELEQMGTAQNRKIYARHGVGANMYGVSYANLKLLKKRIKTDQALAQALWTTGNHDARVLATMIAAPKQVTEDLLESWVRDLDSAPLTDAFSDLVAQTPYARTKAEAWLESDDDHVGHAGWRVFVHLANHDSTLPDSYFEPYLTRIEQSIHHSKNWTREAMNMALIAIGSRNAALEPIALGCAARIGRVEVDHGETACETPDAAAYIRKTRAHREARAKVTA